MDAANYDLANILGEEQTVASIVTKVYIQTKQSKQCDRKRKKNRKSHKDDTTILLQEDDFYGVERTFRDVFHLPVSYFTQSELETLNITVSTLVVGDHTVMRQALYKAMGNKRHLTHELDRHRDCYPSSIRSFLKRPVWTTCSKRLKSLPHPWEAPLFLKPKTSTKLFAGRVVASKYEIPYTGDNKNQTTWLYCSPVLPILSEYRVFVCLGTVLGAQHYAGEPSILLTEQHWQVVRDCIATFERSCQVTAGYALDFGIIATDNDNKETDLALIEFNDGFALGSYGLDEQLYTKLLLTRWIESTSTPLEQRRCFLDHKGKQKVKEPYFFSDDFFLGLLLTRFFNILTLLTLE